MGRYAGADAPKSLMNLYGGIASVCSFYILFVFPEVWTVIRVISNDSAQLFGAGGSIQRSGAEGARSIKTSPIVTISMAAPFSGAPAAPDTAPAPHPPARQKCPPGCDTRRPERPDLPLPGTRYSSMNSHSSSSLSLANRTAKLSCLVLFLYPFRVR